DAKAQGEAIRKADPKNPMGPYLIGAALAGQGKSDEALQRLDEALALGGSPADIEKAKGDAYSQLGKFGEAETADRAAIGQSPRHVGALVGLGLVLLRQNKLPPAAELLGQAKAASPDAPKVRLAMSALRIREGNPAEGIKELEGVPFQARSTQWAVTLGQ